MRRLSAHEATMSLQPQSRRSCTARPLLIAVASNSLLIPFMLLISTSTSSQSRLLHEEDNHNIQRSSSSNELLASRYGHSTSSEMMLLPFAADFDRERAGLDESLVVSGEEYFEKLDKSWPRPPHRLLNFTEFSSSATFLVVVTEASTYWRRESWMVREGEHKFLLARGCNNLQISLRAASGEYALTSNEEWTADILIANSRIVDHMTFKVKGSESEDLDQRLRIARMYHHADVKGPLPTDDGFTNIRIVHSMEAGPHSVNAYDARFRSQFHSMMSSQYFGDPDRMYTPYYIHTWMWFQPAPVAFSGKRDHVAIFIHKNCKAPNRRQKFVETLMNAGLQVDAPGRCLHNIDEPDWITLSKWPFSPQVVTEQYKFGFAIENTLCSGGYATEKFLAILKAGIVPIVMSYRDPVTGEQYPNYDQMVPFDENHLPNQSYIDLGAFTSGKDAASYIRDIAENETKYNSMLWYKNLTKEQQDERIAEMKRRPINSGLSAWQYKDEQHEYMCNMARVLLRNDGHTRLKPLPKEDCRNEDVQWDEF